MKMRILTGRSVFVTLKPTLLCAALLAWANLEGARAETIVMPDKLQEYVDERVRDFDQIPSERQEVLQSLADYILAQRKASRAARLTFICTHNSRRSQMAQIWAAAAASHYGVKDVQTFSGGTEVTAFNPRTVAALKRAGLQIEPTKPSLNPHYVVTYQGSEQPLICFSKVYDELPNPTDNYCAVMTCSQADENCPVVRGSTLRIALPYADPKLADDTPQESDTYDARSRQICLEMLYAFWLVKAAGD
jgi:arsenate reductase (thioredoxin)